MKVSNYAKLKKYLHILPTLALGFYSGKPVMGTPVFVSDVEKSRKGFNKQRWEADMGTVDGICYTRVQLPTS